MASTLGSRLAYQNAAKAIAAAGKSPERAVMSPSYLRFEVALTANVTRYQFDVLVNETTGGSQNFPTVQKLNLQDAFYVSEMGFFLCVPSSVGDTTFPLLTYPNAIQLTTGADNYNSLYNGYAQLIVNQRVILPNWNLSRHYVVNQTQQSGASNLDQLNAGTDGFYPVEPNVVLVGDKKNEFTVTLPNGMATVTANSRLVCICHGILAQNVSSVN